MTTWAALLAPLVLDGTPKIQLPYAVKWLAMESGGNPCSVGDPRQHGPDGQPREIGIAQLYNPDDLTGTGVSAAELRAYCVPGDQHETVYRGKKVRGFSQKLSRPLSVGEMQTQARLTVRKIRTAAAAAGKDLLAIGAGALPAWSPNRRDFWRLVKLQHGLPGLSRSGLPAVTAKLGRPPRDWQEFKNTIAGTPIRNDPRTEGARDQFAWIMGNAERCASTFAESQPGVA
jgi:hypothetical protein